MFEGFWKNAHLYQLQTKSVVEPQQILLPSQGNWPWCLHFFFNTKLSYLAD